MIGGVHGIVESGRQQLGEGPTSDGQRLVRVRRSVPLHNVRRRLDHGHQRKQAPWFPHRRIACHFLELGVRAFDLDLFGKRLCRVPVGQGGVRDHHSIGQAGILRSKTHADNASPIMHDKVDVDEPQFVDEQRPHPLDVAVDGVVLEGGRFVRHAHTDKVGCDHSIAGCDEWSDLMPPQVRP